MIKNVISDRIGKKKKKKNYNVLSFFSGAMGLDIGLEKEGFNILLSCEYDKASRNTIVENNPNVGLIGDLRNYTVTDILKYANLTNNKDVDLIVGGPPCQAFSTAGKRLGFSDDRGNVFLKYLEIIEIIKPKYFVIENVRGLLSSILQIEDQDNFSSDISREYKDSKGSSLLYIIKRMEASGYNLSFDLYNSANFGVPQIRERVIIIGTTDEKKVNRLTPTHDLDGNFGLKKWNTLKDVFSKIKHLEEHEYLEYNDKRKKYLSQLKSGENWKSLPKKLQIEALGKAYYLGGGKTGFLRRLSLEKPSPTLVTTPSMPATDLCHPNKLRPLSVEEYKVIQEFPLDWILCGTTSDKYKQLGNAVPVGLGKAIAKEIINHMNKTEVKKIQNFKYSRYKNTSYDQFIKKMTSLKSISNQTKLF